MEQRRMMIARATHGDSLADVLERVLDKGIVIAGDIKVKLVDIELLAIQIRLVICSVDKAREMGMDWWLRTPDLCSKAALAPEAEDSALGDFGRRLAEIEEKVAAGKGGRRKVAAR